MIGQRGDVLAGREDQQAVFGNPDPVALRALEQIHAFDILLRQTRIVSRAVLEHGCLLGELICSLLEIPTDYRLVLR
jgi:hypothetical protein